MDIFEQVEITLRNAGYDTWLWKEGDRSVTCFEDPTLIGFVHVFASTDELLSNWKSVQHSLLISHAPALRASGAKAWNVYSVFLALDAPGPNTQSLERIEEDFTMTRKIARANVRSSADVQHALLPLLTIKSQPILESMDFETRLRDGLVELPKDAVAAFLDALPAPDISRLLGEKP